MPPRTTFSGSSPSPVDGDVFLNEYSQRLKSLFDAAAFPLTAVAGTGNAVTATLDPPLDAGGLVNGMKFTITWGAANTGAVTLAINGGTAVPVVDADNVALAASALAAGRRSLIEFVGTSFRILSSAGGGAAGGGPTYQAFTASGTWTKPTGYDPDTVVQIECWGAGGGGGNATAGSAGGGGGAYSQRLMRIADIPSSVTVTIGAGGAVGAAGGSTSFGSLLTAFGGGFGGNGVAGSTGGGGGGGGGEIAVGANGTTGTAGNGGAVNGASGGTGVSTGAAAAGSPAIFGGGGGGGGNGNVTSGNGGNGGNSVYGGGGGGGAGFSTQGTGGISVFGGNGGTVGSAGVAPGGGGGRNAAGARGECRIRIFG